MGDKLHKPHPKCACGKPLFKSLEKGGRVTPADPYKFCRNVACERNSPGPHREIAHQAKGSPTLGAASKDKLDKVGPELKNVSAYAMRARVDRAKKAPRPKAQAAPAEHPGVSAARKRIRDLVLTASAGAPRSAIGLVLALVTQETGNKSAANALIQEHKLDELFGLQQQ